MKLIAIIIISCFITSFVLFAMFIILAVSENKEMNKDDIRQLHESVSEKLHDK